MRCFIFAATLLAVFKDEVHADIDFGALESKFHQIVVKGLDKKNGVSCDKYTDNKCPNDHVTFWLYLKDDRDNPRQLFPSDENTIRDAPFMLDAPVKVLVHGYTMNRDKAINEVLRPEYFKSSNKYNIISVDWSDICKQHCYTEGALSIPTVGFCVAEFLKQLQNIHREFENQIHLLGHSMGAHVVSWASQTLDVPRVTQFDPALPLFTDSDDLFVPPRGTTVDVWHSNSGAKGRKDTSGSLDLYLNDETDQPGCNCDTSCSHLRAVSYYGETITNSPMKAFKCDGFSEYRDGKCAKPASNDDLVDVGETMSSNPVGSFLTFTNADPPYTISGDDFIDEGKFNSFKDSRDSKCPAVDATKILGEVLLDA